MALIFWRNMKVIWTFFHIQSHPLEEEQIPLKSADFLLRQGHLNIGKEEIPFFARLSIKSDSLRRTGKIRKETTLQDPVEIEDGIKPPIPKIHDEFSHLFNRPKDPLP